MFNLHAQSQLYKAERCSGTPLIIIRAPDFLPATSLVPSALHSWLVSLTWVRPPYCYREKKTLEKTLREEDALANAVCRG